MNFFLEKMMKLSVQVVKKNVFVKEDVPISKAEKLVKCGRCGVYVRWEKLQKVNTIGEVEE